MTDNGMIEAFRSDASFVIPEIFYRESKGFQYCGPRLEDCRGDEQGVIETFRGRLKTA